MPMGYFPGHSPLLTTLMLAHSAAQALPYVLPSQPHTGSYCIVHIQSGLGLATQASLLLHDAIEMTSTLSVIYKVFINMNFSLK